MDKKWNEILFLFVFIILICSCTHSGKKNHPLNDGMYDFDDPKIISLAPELDEISGIVYYPKDTSVFAIVDEAGILFKIPLKDPNHFRQWRFDKKRDFEDLILIDSNFYALVSNGDIEKIYFENDSIRTIKFDFSGFSKNVNEFEAIYKRPSTNEIILVCKSCESDPKKAIGRFSFHYSDSIPYYELHSSVDMVPVSDKLDDSRHLKASAAAINPVTSELYILSTIQKMIVKFSADGEFRALIKLDPELFKQAEGIAFTPEADLIISNESAEEGPANLFLFKNKWKKQ